MSWFNRILGGGLGFLFGGPIGSMIGLAIGHMLDKANESSHPNLGESQSIEIPYNTDSYQVIFFSAIFSLLAKVAKADGRISEEEGHHFLDILEQMGLQGKQRQFAISTFNEAKNSSYTHQEFASQLYQIINKMPLSYRGQNRMVILQQLFYTLVSMAAIDGQISRTEDQILREIAAAFYFDETVIRQVYSQFYEGQSFTMDTAYDILGVSVQASNEEIRNAYRKLVKETHPDTLIQQGLPPEMRASAEKRFREIQEAWEQIRKQRAIT